MADGTFTSLRSGTNHGKRKRFRFLKLKGKKLVSVDRNFFRQRAIRKRLMKFRQKSKDVTAAPGTLVM